LAIPRSKPRVFAIKKNQPAFKAGGVNSLNLSGKAIQPPNPQPLGGSILNLHINYEKRFGTVQTGGVYSGILTKDMS